MRTFIMLIFFISSNANIFNTIRKYTDEWNVFSDELKDLQEAIKSEEYRSIIEESEQVAQAIDALIE